jgi:signal transduction histidine kinase/ligand-binding sensor domain-containing protein
MRITFTAFMIFALLSGLAQDQQIQISFEHLHPAGTIRSTEFKDILQDAEGQIWIAGDGLIRYDGVGFAYYNEVNDGASLRGLELNCLLYDTVRRRLLIGTRNLGVLVYYYDTDEVKRIPSLVGNPIINQLVLDADGTVWGQSFNSGLFYVKNDTLKQARLTNYKRLTASYLLPWGKQLLIGDQLKVYIVEDYRVVDSIEISKEGLGLSIHSRISSLHRDGQHRLYIGTEKNGLFIYDLNERKLLHHFPTDIPPFFNRINRIHTTRDGWVWTLTQAGGIGRYHPVTGRIEHISHNPLNQNSLYNDNCHAILEDRTGIVWIATTGAINKYEPNKILFRHITSLPYDPFSLSDRMVRSVFEDSDGTLIVGTEGGYLNFIDRNTYKVVKLKISMPGDRKKYAPYCVAQLNPRQLLIGTTDGILVMDRKTRKLSLFQPLQKLVGNTFIRQIIKKDNELYILSQDYLLIYDLISANSRIFKEFSGGRHNAYGPSFVYQDSFDRIWVGANGGISLYQPDTTFIFFPIPAREGMTLPARRLILAAHQINGYLWISTFNDGVWKLKLTPAHQEKEVVVREDIPEINQNTIYGTLPDSKGFIWMSSNQGLLRYNPSARSLIAFYPEQGVQALEFNRLAYLQRSNGEFVFGGVNGINIFRPEQTHVYESLPRPVLLSASVFRDNGSEYHNLRQQKKLQIAYNHSSLSFHFIIPEFTALKNYIVEYHLEGHDPLWMSADITQVFYSRLHPGSYTFRLRTRNHENKMNETSLEVTILPPFWQRGWFITIGFMFIIIVIVTAFRVQANISRHNREKLEKMLQERTAEIEHSRAELKALNEKKDLIFSILSHDLRSPLTTLKGFLWILEESAQHISPEEIRNYAKNIGNSVSSALDLIDNTLYWAMSQTGTIKLNPTEFSLNDILKKIYHLYHLTATRKKVELLLEAPETIRIKADENMIYVALRNVVSNAIKYTPEYKKVVIRLSKNHHQAIVTIRDEGIGMSKSYIDSVLSQQNFAPKKGTANEKGTGLGLILCQRFIAENNGIIEIHSVENQGTEFNIYLPLVGD